MRWLAAPLAAVLATVLIGCGDDGAEPGASEEATLVLDFTPNAVHAGLYAALESGDFAQEGLDLEVREPSTSTDAPKLLASGRADFAILDIHDLAIARERGAEIVAFAALVRRPLAAVIAADRSAVGKAADLDGGSVGVTGLPSDDAVLAAVLDEADLPAGSVERITIGFDSVAALSAGRLDAATAFWNAEGVMLRELGVPTREFRVDDYGAPRYPELVVVASAQTITERPEMVRAFAEALQAGHERLGESPEAALGALTEAVPELDAEGQRAQLDALLQAEAVGDTSLPGDAVLRRWAEWDADRGIVDDPPAVDEAFARP